MIERESERDIELLREGEVVRSYVSAPLLYLSLSYFYVLGRRIKYIYVCVCFHRLLKSSRDPFFTPISVYFILILLVLEKKKVKKQVIFIFI